MQILLGNPDLASTSKIKSLNGTVEKPNINQSFVSIQIENEQLKKDNKYLVDLLKQTKQFSKLADYIKDSGGLAQKLEPLSPL